MTRDHASRAGSAEARGRPRVCGGCGGWWSTLGRWPVGRAVARRPPPPFQVPSASRRGGLKTPGGVARPPWGRGGRARGESGGASRLPQTPPSPWGGRGGAWRAAPRSLCSRGRREGATRRSLCGPWPCVRCVCAPSASLGEGGNPPGACGVSEPAFGGWALDALLCETFPDPLRSAVFLSDLAGQRQLPRSSQLPAPSSHLRGGAGLGVGGENVPCQGRVSRRNKTLEKPRTTLSGGSLGSCVDEERS